MIEAGNRAYLLAYRRNAKLMGLMEQVARSTLTSGACGFAGPGPSRARNAQALERLQERGLADTDLDPRLAATR